MECGEARALISQFVERDLPERARQAVDEHLSHCYVCQEELDEVTAVVDACREALRHPAPRNRFAELRPLLAGNAAVPTRSNVVAWRGRRVAGAIAALAGAAAVVIILVSLGAPVARTAHQWAMLANWTEPDEGVVPATEPEPRSAPLLLGWRQRILWYEALAEDVRGPQEEARAKAAREPAASSGKEAASPSPGYEPVSEHRAAPLGPPPAEARRVEHFGGRFALCAAEGIRGAVWSLPVSV